MRDSTIGWFQIDCQGGGCTNNWMSDLNDTRTEAKKRLLAEGWRDVGGTALCPECAVKQVAAPRADQEGC